MPCCGGGGSASKTDRFSNFADACYAGDLAKMEERLKVEAKQRGEAAVLNEPPVESEKKGKKQRVQAVLVPSPPMILAAQKGDCEVMKFLLSKGADPRVIGPTGETPLHIAVFHGHTDLVSILLKTSAAADVNTKLAGDFLTGMTPLHIAVTSGRPEIVDMLLRKGANPSVRDAHGLDCFEMAEFWAKRENESLSTPTAQNNQVLQLLRAGGQS